MIQALKNLHEQQRMFGELHQIVLMRKWIAYSVFKYSINAFLSSAVSLSPNVWP